MRKKRSDGVVVYNSARGRVFRIKYRDADGKQIMETAGAERDGMTRAEAAKLRRARVADVDKGWRKPAPLTFETAIAEWFASAEIEKAWKPRTVYAYRGIVARLNDTFGRRPLAEIEPGDVVAYKGAMLKTHGPYSVSLDLVILHQFFKWALIAKGLRSNPAQGVPHPRLPKWRGQALAPELVQALLRAFEDGQDRCVFLMLILTGVRRMELQALRWANVDLIENRLRVADSKTKTGERSIALPPMLAEELWQHRRRSRYASDHDLVFCHPTRGTVYRVDHQWKPALKKACARAGVTLPVGMRPMHDVGRVTSITNGVALTSTARSCRHVRVTRASRRRSVTSTLPASCSTMKRLRSRSGCSDFLPNFLPDSQHLRTLRMMLRRLKARYQPDSTALK
jgi:integrase